jgi:hypothetical protein
MDLIKIARNSTAISKFLQEDLSAYLTRCDLLAASNALKEAGMAIDKRSAYWSVVNHLEAAEAKCESAMSGITRSQTAEVLIYIAAIRALVLKDLGEHRLVRGALDKSLRIVEKYNRDHDAHEMSDIVSSWNPANWVSLWRHLNRSPGREAGEFNANDFWVALGYPGPHALWLARSTID